MDENATAAGPQTSKAPPPVQDESRVYIAYVTLMLALVFMLASIDRNIMSVLLVPIQQDLKVSDTAMGALTGTAFALVYGTAALPLARLADKGNRRNLIAAALAFWSAATAACGLATSYFTLLLARFGVAAGEAAHSPAIISQIGDLYPPQRRGIAVALVNIGSAVGIGLGAVIAGWIAQHYGWQLAFIVMGIPGLLVAAAIVLTVREPSRGRFEPIVARGFTPGQSVGRDVVALAKVVAIPRLIGAALMLHLAFQAFIAWVPAFFIRVHGLSTAEMSSRFGAVVGVSALLSMVLAGVVGDRLSRLGERWRAYYLTIVSLVGLPFLFMLILAQDTTVAWASLFMFALVSGGAVPASMTAAIVVAPPHLRGLMTAAMTLCVTAVGGGLGPLLIGFLNDSLRGVFGDEAIRYTLMTVPLCWIISGALFYWTGKAMEGSIAGWRDESAQPTTDTAPLNAAGAESPITGRGT